MSATATARNESKILLSSSVLLASLIELFYCYNIQTGETLRSAEFLLTLILVQYWQFVGCMLTSLTSDFQYVCINVPSKKVSNL